MKDSKTFNNLVELCDYRAHKSPDKTAFIYLTDGEDKESKISYGQLRQKALRIAALLRETGKPGQPVVLLYPSSLDFICAFWGCLYAGMIAVPVNPPVSRKSRLKRLINIVRDSRAKALLSTSEMVVSIKKLETEANIGLKLDMISTDALSEICVPDETSHAISDIAFLQYTSGSTGSPKGVMVTHRNLIHNQQMIKEGFRHSEKTVFAGWLPLFHDMGLIGNVIQPFYLGILSVLMSPVAFIQKPVRWLKAISKYGATTSGGPNFAFDLCTRRIADAELSDIDLSSWSVAFNGAEPISAEVIECFTKRFGASGFKPEAFYPCYGLAEATLFVTGGIVAQPPAIKYFCSTALKENKVDDCPSVDTAVRLVSSGRPWGGQLIRIVNPETMAPCGEKEIGEVWISGESVTAGYWRNDEATQMNFRATLVSDPAKRPYFRTGDLGFFSQEELFITGRLKELLIIRGVNYYPQDIESTAQIAASPYLRGHAGAAFIIADDADQALCLVNEVERTQLNTFDKQAVARQIQQQVFDEHGIMIKHIAFLMPLSLPMTSSGKIQRLLAAKWFSENKLKEIGRVNFDDDKACMNEWNERVCEPIDPEIHRKILKILGDILETPVDGVPPQTPIYTMGIDSITAVQLHMVLEQTFSCTLRLDDILSGPSLAGLATLVSQAPFEDGRVSVPSGSATRQLSHNQKSLWFEYLLAPKATGYNIFFAVQPDTPLDDAALSRAATQLMQKHSILCATYHGRHDADDGVAIDIRQSFPAPFFKFDMRQSTPEDIRRTVAASAYTPFDLGKCAWALELYDSSSCGQVLLFKIHHIAADLWSMQLLFRDLFGLYAKIVSGETGTVQTAPYRYSDFTCWQTNGLEQRPDVSEMIRYWQGIYADMPPILELPYDKAVSDEAVDAGAAVTLSMPHDLMLKVQNLASRLNVSLNALLLSAYTLLLHKYTFQDDICVGVPFSGRTRPEFSDVVGCFVNMALLRIKIQTDHTFEAMAEQVKNDLAQAARRQDLPFRLVVEKILEGGRRGHGPLYRTQFVFQKLHLLSEASFLMSGEKNENSFNVGGLCFTPCEMPIRTVQTDLDVVVLSGQHSLHVRWIYNINRFDSETMARLSESYVNLLEKIVLAPDTRLSGISCISDRDRAVMAKWNNTTAPFDETLCIHQLFETQVRKTPSSAAIHCKGQIMSYAQLNAMADIIAGFLFHTPIEVEAAVAICMARDIRSVAAILGILKSGGTYVPIDPSYPSQRRQYIVNDADVRIILVDESSKALFADADIPVVSIEDILIDNDPARRARNRVSGVNRSHIIYTSGSTGLPKGVEIEHKSVVALIEWARKVYSSEETRCVLAGTSFCFDLSVFELFVPLATGGCVELVDNILALTCVPSQVTLLNTVPSAAQSLLEQGLIPESVLTVNLAGEPLNQSLVDALYGLPTIKKVYDLYGPSEDTTYSTYALRHVGGAETIGKPIANTTVYLVDERKEQVPVGAKGQIVLSGHGLSRGYVNRSELTEAAFFMSDKITGKRTRFYQTGDLAKFDREGNLRLLGRLDNQIKLRGYRIELGEVESAVSKIPLVRECVVSKCSIDASDYLICYWAGHEDKDIAITCFQSFLRDYLPDFMIPAFFNRMDRLPRNSNGKIDRKSLPEPDLSSQNRGGEPSTDTERHILEIYSDLLGTRQIGIHNNFFESGGHSLLAVKFLSKLRQALDVSLPLQVFLSNPTVFQLASIIDKNSGRDDGNASVEEIHI